MDALGYILTRFDMLGYVETMMLDLVDLITDLMVDFMADPILGLMIVNRRFADA